MLLSGFFCCHILRYYDIIIKTSSEDKPMGEMKDVLHNEINMINSICERYFDRMYNNIGFTLTFYGVIIAAGLNSDIVTKATEAKIILMYLLPFGTYLF